MCGRYTFVAPPELTARLFELDELPDLAPRYNIAPSQAVPTVLPGETPTPRRLRMMHWGLIPSWTRDLEDAARMINARSETADQKPAFRSAMRSRRCLIPADGFYEWKKLPRGKQPYYIRLAGGQPFAFAGLWESWMDAAGEMIESCAILTCAPNSLLADIHLRMPVILPPEAWNRWLDTDLHDPPAVRDLLRPFPAEQMEAYPVSKAVNNPANDDPGCIAAQGG